MRDHLMNTGYVEDGEPSHSAEGTPAEWLSPISLLSNTLCCEMRLPDLAAQCIKELDHYRRGDPSTEAFGLELLRRAIRQSDQEAWVWVQHCFGGMVRGWLRRHPQREVACRLESEENYVAQAFERFWQATASNQRVQFRTLAAALQYLHASLNGAILDMLRAYARPGEVPLSGPGEPGEPLVEDDTENSEAWESLHMLLINPREQRVAYLLFYCGLKPREIIRFCPQEWSDVQEIYRLRRNIIERLLRNADYLRWRLSERE